MSHHLMDTQPYFKELIQTIRTTPLDKLQIARLKSRLCKKYGVKKIPKDLEILLHAPQQDIPLLRQKLLTKPIRTLSGVAPIAIMTQPRHCPHGRCTYCPGGIGSPFGDVPQSYTGKEPASMRAIRNGYDAYLQVLNRLEYYVIGGHIPHKAELIIMGGTFPSYEWEYQETFVKRALAAMNDFSELFFPDGQLALETFKAFFELPGDIKDPQRAIRIQQRMRNLYKDNSLQAIQHKNETAIIRCVGMTMETRPDYRIFEQASKMLELGCTRVELGIQSVYDDTLATVHRDHDTQDSKDAIHLLKNLGFKINAHMMPGLPGWTYESDLHSLRTLFTDQDYRPDMLKIYPCMVMQGTPLYEQWKNGQFTAMDTPTATKLLAEFLPEVPRYVRVMRVQRDIPTYRTQAGVDKTNLRQYVDNTLTTTKKKSQDIRSREIRNSEFTNTTINVLNYTASKATEWFISIDTPQDYLVGFCRMRFPDHSTRPEIDQHCAIIRELHVNGNALQVGTQHHDAPQHRGFGKSLLRKAEQIAIEHHKTKMVVISGIGVREYYRKLGYHRQGPYMVKDLRAAQ